MLEKRDLGKYAIIGLVLVSLIGILLVFKGGPTGYAIYTKTDLGDIERGANWNKIDNGMGSYSLEIYSNIINLLNGSDYIPINTTLIHNQIEMYGVIYDYYRDLNLYEAYFKEKSGTSAPWLQPIMVKKDNYVLTMAPQSLKFTGQTNAHMQQSTAIVDGGTINYQNQFENIDLKYNYNTVNLKEELIIDSLADLLTIKASPSQTDNLILKFKVRSYNINSDNNTNMKINGQKIDFKDSITTDTSDEVYFLDENNETIYYFTKPIAYDSNGGQINLNYSLDYNLFGNLVVEIFTPYSWLQNATYPVYIDPSIKIGEDNGGADAYVSSAFPNTNYGSSDKLDVKGLNTLKLNSYIDFNISSIPSNQIIDNSLLCLYMFSDSGSHTISAYNVYTNWQENTITWNNQPCGADFANNTNCNLTAESSLSNDGNQDNTWQCWNIINMVKKQYAENKRNISIVLRTENNINYIDKFYSKEYSDSSLWPYLNITYHLSDMIAPSLSIVYPTNNTNTTNNQIYVNYTVSDANLQACWYSNDTMSVNTTLTNCANITTVTWSEGQHNIIVWANDSIGNVNSSYVSFFVDSIAPVVNILLPQEGTTYGYNASLALNYSASDTNLQSCWYNLNNGNNITLLNCQNTTFSVAGNGNYILNLYANDSYGLIGSDSVSFSVAVGAPTIILNSPIDFYSSSHDITFSYTPTDIDLQSCELWGDFNGEFKLNQTDNSPDNNVANTFSLNLNDGNYEWNIRCNDSQGHSAFNGNKTFYVDTISPSISLTQPTGAKTSRTITASWSVTDLNLQSCWYNVYRGASPEIANNVVNCSLNTVIFSVSSDGNFVFNFYANDSAGNINSVNSSFSVSTSVPINPPSSGSSGGGGGGSFILPNQTGKLQVSLIGNIIAHPGDNKKMLLAVKNTGRIFLNNCRLIAKGNISSWIYSTNLKGIAPGQNIDFDFDLNVPEEITSEITKGSLEFKCEEANNVQNISVSIPKEFGLIEIKDIKQEGDILKISYVLDGSKFVGDNIDVEIWLTNENETELKRIVDKSPINKEGLIERNVEMQLPEGLEEGVYFIYFAFSSDANNFIKKPVVLSVTGRAVLDSEKGKFWIYILFLLIIGIAIIFIWRRHSKADKTDKQN